MTRRGSGSGFSPGRKARRPAIRSRSRCSRSGGCEARTVSDSCAPWSEPPFSCRPAMADRPDLDRPGRDGVSNAPRSRGDPEPLSRGPGPLLSVRSHQKGTLMDEGRPTMDALKAPTQHRDPFPEVVRCTQPAGCKEAAEAAGHEVHVVDYSRCVMNITSHKPEVYFGEQAPSGSTRSSLGSGPR